MNETNGKVEANVTFDLLDLSELFEQSLEIYEKLLIKREWQIEYSLAFLRKSGEDVPESIKDLLRMRIKWPDKYNRLLESIKLQLGQKDVVCNEKRVRGWKTGDDRSGEIYEFKSSSGLGLRLFFFFHNDNMVVCTHGWLKDNEKRKKEQSRQFERAALLRGLFLKIDGEQCGETNDEH